MQHWHLVLTGILLLAFVMTGGCAGLLMGDLKTEISDTSSITIPLPVSSVLSVLVGQNSSALPSVWSPTREKGDPVSGKYLTGASAFQVKPSKTDPSGIITGPVQPATGFSPVSGKQDGTVPRSAPGPAVALEKGPASCSPVAGAKVTVTLVGITHETHVTDCITQENGDFSFELPMLNGESPVSQYILNFDITAPGYTLPSGSSTVVTDMVNGSDGPWYTFNVCLQQPSEPNAMAFTRGGIAVIGKINS